LARRRRSLDAPVWIGTPEAPFIKIKCGVSNRISTDIPLHLTQNMFSISVLLERLLAIQEIPDSSVAAQSVVFNPWNAVN
jgi:hypothetical protein